jgi:hypothetical protein
LQRNNVEIKNVLKKKNYKIKLSISLILKKIDKYKFFLKNKIEKICGKIIQESTIFFKKITK